MGFGQQGLVRLCFKHFTLGILIFLSTACEPEKSAKNDTFKAADTIHENIPGVIATVGYAGDASSLAASAKIFVFARVPGQRMPLAVESFGPADLPLQVGFSRPGNGVEQIEVVARLSTTGVVNRLEGDPEVISPTLTVGGSGIESVQLMIPEVGSAHMVASAASGPSLSVVVEKPDGVAVPVGAKVFIIVHSAVGSSAMPAAVKSIDKLQFPLMSTVSDADSILAMHKMSMFDKVKVFARLSMGGYAESRSGDWESLPQVVKPGQEATLQLTLNQQVE